MVRVTSLSGHTLDLQAPAIESRPTIKETVIVLAHNDNYRYLGLNCQVERAFLEWQQCGFDMGGPRALWENPERDSLLLHIFTSLSNGSDSVLAVSSIDKDGA